MPSEVGEAGAKLGHSPRDVLLVIVGLIIRTIGQKELGNRHHNSQHPAPCSYLLQTSAMGLQLPVLGPGYALHLILPDTWMQETGHEKKELEKEDLAAKGTQSPGFKHGSLCLTLFCSWGHL